MSRAAAVALAMLSALSGAGCLFGEVRGIPCAADSECPTGYFCDLPRDTCRQEGDGVGVPLLVIEEVRDLAGNEVRSPFIPPGETSVIGFLIDNTGAGAAESIDLTFAELYCLHAAVDHSTVPDVIEGGARAQIDVAMTPADDADCEGLKIVDWFLTWSGRETRGDIDVNITGL